MSVALATTYHPRGEIGRLRRLLPELHAVYSSISLSLPPTATAEDVAAIQALNGVHVLVNDEWQHGRYNALKAGLECGADAIHYADMDRLLRWVETRPDEWRTTVEQVGQVDCLVIGRTAAAWETHPRALYEAERIINRTFSKLLGQDMDFGAGSKGFSRRAAEFLIASTTPGRALGADTEWPVLLYRAGLRVTSVLVDGLDWESADRYQEQAADADTQRRLAAAYDNVAQNWAMRVRVTQQIVDAGIDAWLRPLTGAGMYRYVELRRHSMRVKPGQNLSRAGVELARRVGNTTGPFERVITSTIPRAYETAVAMGFAVDEQLEPLGMIDKGVEEEVAWDAGFAGWGEVYRRGGAVMRYAGKHAAFVREVAAALPPGGAALIVSHGGIVEAQAVGCLPDADHAAWGGACSWCEGVRLTFDGEKFTDAKVLRVGG
ncbi:MAG: histidine phosphatase family protein [Chloroflexi bacterium]|nr:histidine phosphatase family protein [Chloroflexota bacterium]